MYAGVQGVSGLRVRAADGDQEVDHEESDLCNAAVTGSSSQRELRDLHLNRPLLKIQRCSHYENVCISVHNWMQFVRAVICECLIISLLMSRCLITQYCER